MYSIAVPLRIACMAGLLLSACNPHCQAETDTAPQGRRVISLDHDWGFRFGDGPSGCRKNEYEVEWRRVDIPHDWSLDGLVSGCDTGAAARMEGPFDPNSPGGAGGGYLNGGTAWYRKNFSLPEEAKGRLVFIQFDGVFMDCEVWLNGVAQGQHPYGYTGFQFDVTPYVKFGGDNLLEVRVRVQQRCSRWYSGAGIYRHVRCVITAPVHVVQWGTYVTTPEVDDTQSRVQVRTRVRNDGGGATHVALSVGLVAPGSDDVVAQGQETQSIEAGGEYEFFQTFHVPNPRRWSLETPDLYTVRTEVRTGDELQDCVSTPFGIRTLEFTAEDGFLLNGKRVEIRGVNNHHDLGPLGAAVNRHAIERQVDILKGMGCNAIRTAHNPPAPELLEACDRMGMLVMVEAFDEWILPKSRMKFGYGRFFREWSEQDLVSMIRRDRNHPSVILWSIGNEIKEQRAPQGGAMARRLVGICHREDPSRPVTAGCNYAGPASQNGFTDALDVIGINYHIDDYQKFRGKRLIAAETSSALSARGEYGLRIEPDGRVTIDVRAGSRVVSYDLDHPSWGCKAEESLLALKRSPWVMGEFVWTGFDYFGEPTPHGWPSRSSYFGIVDLCGFPKDRYYLYQSQWTDLPMVHIFPHWNWPGFEGKPIPVWAYSNGDSVELFLNGQSLGVQDQAARKGLHWEWQVPYEPGVLKAVALKAGGVVATKEVRTVGPPARLILVPDRAAIQADGDDTVFVEVRVVDRDGFVCPNADDKVTFSVEGPGSVAGVGNGDPTCHEPIRASEHSAFHGLCLVVLRAAHTTGDIGLTATAAGLEPARVTIRTVE